MLLNSLQTATGCGYGGRRQLVYGTKHCARLAIFEAVHREQAVELSCSDDYFI